MAESFKPGDLVWAKLDDYPYWPGKIASECIEKELKSFKNEEEGIAILFFGTELTYALVSPDCIKNFEENFEAYSRAKVRKTIKIDFEAALEMAKTADTIVEPPLELDEDEREDEGYSSEVSELNSEASSSINNDSINSEINNEVNNEVNNINNETTEIKKEKSQDDVTMNEVANEEKQPSAGEETTSPIPADG